MPLCWVSQSYPTKLPQTYGLILPASKKRPAPRVPSSSLFGVEDDEGSGAGGASGAGGPAAGKRSMPGHVAVNMAVKRQQEVAAKQAAEQEKAAKEEDASLFDYDSWVDNSAAPKRKRGTAATDVKDRRPQYLQAMMEVWMIGPHAAAPFCGL